MDGPLSSRTIPALVAHHKSHLPTNCLLLLGVPQLNELDIKLDTHRKIRRLPLESYDPLLDFDADTRLQCRLSEKDLLAWAEHHLDSPIGHTQHSYLDVVYPEGMASPRKSPSSAQLAKNTKRFIKQRKAPCPPSATIPLSLSTSRRGGSMSRYLARNGAPEPSLSSHDGLWKCWRVDCMLDLNPPPLPAPT